MDEKWFILLQEAVRKRPLAVLQFDEEEWEHLRGSSRGLSEFTIARSHGTFGKLKAPTACMIFFGQGVDAEARFGIVSSRRAVSTLESRVKVTRSQRIRPSSKAGLLELITASPHSTRLRQRLASADPIIVLSSELSAYLVQKLAETEENHLALRSAAEFLSLSENQRSMLTLQHDAVQTALRVFGLQPDNQADSLYLVAGQETALARVKILEDAVIEHDARHVPGFGLTASDVTGQAIFRRGLEVLEVYTANRRPLEQVFGVDLIYLNAIRENIVMLQYKMLEPARSGRNEDWIYRPDDLLESEIDRMKQFQREIPPSPYEYRLNSQVFYLRFVKRDGGSRNAGITMPIDHFERLREDPGFRGPRGGFRISFNSLAGRHLRQTAFPDLVRSGYIGAHAETTEHLTTLVRSVVQGEKSVVAAIQSQADDAYEAV